MCEGVCESVVKVFHCIHLVWTACLCVNVGLALCVITQRQTSVVRRASLHLVLGRGNVIG